MLQSVPVLPGHAASPAVPRGRGAEGPWAGPLDPDTLLLPGSLSPPLGAHLGQPCLGIQNTQEAVGLVYQEAQAGLPRRLGDGHPGQQLLPTLLGMAGIWLCREPTHMCEGSSSEPEHRWPSHCTDK